MDKKFYTVLREYRIYALIDRELKVAFVGKSYAESLAPTYSVHANGQNYLTADYFGKVPPKVKPELLILQELCCTSAVAYKHIVAWSLYLEEHGFLMLTQTGTMLNSEILLPETKEIYQCISQDKLEDVLQRKYYPSGRKVEKDPLPTSTTKEAKQKLSLRLDKEDKAAFLELKRALNITQREVFRLLLDNATAEHMVSSRTLIRQQSMRIEDLENKLQEVTNQLTEEHVLKKNDHRVRDLLDHAKSVVRIYIQTVWDKMYYLEPSLKPTRKPQNNIHNFSYPKESGYENIQLEEMVYGSSHGLVFVLGWTEDGEAIKLRHYGKREFLGYDPRINDLAVKGSWWQVHYHVDDTGAADLMAALPLPPNTKQYEKEEPVSLLDKVIRDIEKRKE